MSLVPINATNINPDSAPAGAAKINLAFIETDAAMALATATAATVVTQGTSIATNTGNIATNTSGISSNTAALTVQSALLGKIITLHDTQMAFTNDVTGNADTANLIAAINLAASSARTVPGSSDPSGTAVVYFGPGTYYINAANALMGPATLAAKLRGLKLVGAGSSVTTLVFMPSVAGPMMTNQRWQSINFIDLSFNCTTSGCDFMQSQELAGLTNIQAFNFVRCGWSGFQNDFMLTGGNNNSEWTWDTCSFGATSQHVLYVPPSATATITASNQDILLTNSPEAFPLGATMQFTATLGNLILNTQYYIVASTTTSIRLATTAGGTPITPTVSGTLSASAGSDQFLNFSFHNCKYDPGSSNATWVTLNKGGSVSFSGFCDVSGWSPTVDTYLFELLGSTHAQGVMTFKLDKVRMECLSDHALLMHCQWGGGNVSLRNVDMSSQAGVRTNTVDTVFIELINVVGPIITFSDSNFSGQCAINYGSNNFTVNNRISYINCAVLQWPNAAAFVVFTETAGNKGGAPLVDFDLMCRGNDPTEVFPTTLNWQFSTSSVSQPKVANFLGANTDAPTVNGNIQRKLPPNCLLKSVLWNKQANTQTGAYSFTMQTIEGSPTVLSTFAGGAAGSAANPAETALNFWCLTDAQRTLQMVDGVGAGGRTTTFTGYAALVTYIG